MAEALAKRGEQFLPTGERVIFESLDEIEINENPSEVSQHEAWHVLAALLLGVGVKSVDIIPEGNRKGATYLTGYHKLVFAAAHAMGCSGGGHDLHVITMAEGETGDAISGAKSLLAGEKNKRRMLAIATILDKRKSMGGSETWAIFDNVNKNDTEGNLYLMRVISPDGTETQKVERAKEGAKVDLNELITLVRVVDGKKEKRGGEDRGQLIVPRQLPVFANDN